MKSHEEDARLQVRPKCNSSCRTDMRITISPEKTELIQEFRVPNKDIRLPILISRISWGEYEHHNWWKASASLFRAELIDLTDEA